MQEQAILLLSCPDQMGIVATVSKFISEHKGNIVDFDQHSDNGIYFMRVEWDLDNFTLPFNEIGTEFQSISNAFQMDFWLHRKWEQTPTAVFVSSYDHCLYDLIMHNSQKIRKNLASEKAPSPSIASLIDIRCIISNHAEMAAIAKIYNIPFHYIDMSDKPRAEAQQIEILQKEGVELIVLARYMQILSPTFVARYPNQIINIHHSFLPAFKGARPYHQAQERGVKLIGATSHYVTAELDQGPIIAQDIIRISHRDSVQRLIAKGRDLERRVLSEAVKLHLEHRILPYGNKTIIFGNL